MFGKYLRVNKLNCPLLEPTSIKVLAFGISLNNGANSKTGATPKK